MRLKKGYQLPAVLSVWLIGIGAGFIALQGYSSQAGAARAPASAAIGWLAAHRAAGRPLLVMMVHPRCPCTDASLSELGDLLARSHGNCDAMILEYQPDGWPAGPASETLDGIKVPVIQDPDGREAAILGGETSGHCVFVDAQGVIRFYGGITIARGHVGRAPAQDTILDIVAGAKSPPFTAPVFGCALGPECKVASDR